VSGAGDETAAAARQRQTRGRKRERERRDKREGLREGGRGEERKGPATDGRETDDLVVVCRRRRRLV